MPKSLVLGNGNMLVGLDRNGCVRDFYFPFVGLENQVGNLYAHKIGVFVEGAFSWLDDNGWNIQVNSQKETLVGSILAINTSLQVEIHFTDVVYNEKNIFIRKVLVYNTSDIKRTIKIFFNQEFHIYGASLGDTAYFDPIRTTIVHYKGRRVFLINAKTGDKSFDDFSIGNFRIEGKEGTYKDAEDGMLSQNPVEHGSVDSVVGLSLEIPAHEDSTAYYWVIAASSIREANDLNVYIIQKTPEHLIRTTSDFWRAWVNKQNFNFYGLSSEVIDLFKKSLLIVRAHVDNNGSIIASSDSDMLQHGRDTYSYMWPRDAAFAAIALDKAGDSNVAKKFFELCNEIISEEGYFLHKFRPDKSLGSSWHPWIRDGEIALPIQEDETALVVLALWKHYELSRDLEFVESVYNSLIKKAADFILTFQDQKTRLPHPSYDLWEEKYGISTFTASTCYAALIAAAKFAKLLGKTETEEIYQKSAAKMKEAILKYLYDSEAGMFLKMIKIKNGETIHDSVIDASSIYGIFKFDILDVDDKRVARAIKIVEDKIMCKTSVSGCLRYEGDLYYKGEGAPSNPWIITTLWIAQYYIKKAHSQKDLEPVLYWINWTTGKALPSGILPEQLNPYTGEQISASPLVWSHAEYVVTIIEYLQKLEDLGICKVYNPIK